MRKNNIIDYQNPSQNLVTDVLSEFLRESAQKMLQLAIEEEVQNFISSYQDKLLINGSRQVVRIGYLPERNIQTGKGEVAVKVPRVRDRGKEDIKFSSNLIPQYMRRTVTIDVLLPLLLSFFTVEFSRLWDNPYQCILKISKTSSILS